MKRQLLILFIIPLISACSGQRDYAAYVNPFIGTDADGHTFPGTVAPFGMVQLSPDTRIKTSRGSSGYHYSDKSIMGFSHTHYSGTGEGSGGDILFMPSTGEVQWTAGDPDDPSSGYRSAFSHQNEQASPGYYKVLLDDDNIGVELTVSKRAGLQRYTFPKGKNANVILDLQHGINDKADSLYLQVIGNRKIRGFRKSVGGLRMYQKLYFIAEFSQPFSYILIMKDGSIVKNKKEAVGKSLKACFRFGQTEKPIIVRTAISKVDMEGAQKNLNEINGKSFDEVKKLAHSMWNKALGKIEAEGRDEKSIRVFYTALYHACIHPSLDMDVDGRYRSTNNKIYKAENFNDYTNFSLWDTFRALHPLHTIINEERSRDFVKTFIERYEHSGSLPVFELSGNEVPSMIGYHSLPVIADAYVKGIRGYDIDKAVEGMKLLANLPWEKRNLFKLFGFVPYDYTVQSVSRTLEYCFDDWCLAQVLKETGSASYQRYANRANFYRNLFDAETDFMRPKNSAYQWLDEFNPADYSKYYTQANAWQYTVFVPQDVSGLIKLMGSDRVFVTWLDNYFNSKENNKKGMIGQYNHGNEPSHHTAYLYSYAGVPWKTQRIVRRILDTQYGDDAAGLAGNDDAGQMSAWYVLSAVGFYSVTPGTDYYVIGSPIFDRVVIHSDNGAEFEIIAENNGYDHPYIQSGELNGKVYTKSYLRHGDIMKGGRLIFKMDGQANKKRGLNRDDRPPVHEFNDLPIPEIHIERKNIPPDGVITFKDKCTVTLNCRVPGADIYYTIDGSEPQKNSILYKDKFNIERTSTLKAKAYKEGFEASYTAALKFRKLDLMPAYKLNAARRGINYSYREVWLCKKTEDIGRYPEEKKGILSAVKADLGFKLSQKIGVIYQGYVKAPKSGVYTFYLDSDDGSVLYIDDILTVNNDGSHRRRERSGQLALKAGFHKITVKHFQVGGKAKLKLSWQGPGIGKQEIPDNYYFH